MSKHVTTPCATSLPLLLSVCLFSCVFCFFVWLSYWLLYPTPLGFEKEFAPEFWDVVNYNRKERWGFLELPPGMEEPTMLLHRILKFDYLFSMKLPTPCVLWTFRVEGHLPQGSSERGSDFPWAEEIGLPVALNCRGPCTAAAYPTFLGQRWPDHLVGRTTLWLHEHTIQWLSETGESYPPELRDEIQPRLDQLKPSQPAKRSQPPTPPKPNRWMERPKRNRPCKHLKNLLHRTRRELRKPHSRSPRKKGNIWNCKLLLP